MSLQVTKLCMVSGGELAVDSGTLAPELRHWQGLLVVGTAHGTLHILDLALDLGGRFFLLVKMFGLHPVFMSYFTHSVK